jgi:hypothetical protein
MKKRKKIVFLTFHNWKTKRQGGFHKFAEASCLKGYETIFLSFPRPYYIYLKKEERLNKTVLKELRKGIKYKLGSNYLLNITLPTFALPGPLRKYCPNFIEIWLQKKSLRPFKDFANDYLLNTDYFIFESNECILLYDKIKHFFPKSKIIYRPSDPLLANPQCKIINFEKNILKNADWTFIVNSSGLKIYNDNYEIFRSLDNYSILSNGISVEEYKKKYSIPNPLKKKNTVLYIGALDIEWNLIIYASKKLPQFNFIIICPKKPPNYFNDYYKNCQNVTFINGIYPETVPSWVTNCNIVVVPNPHGRFKSKPWGITAKYYQAMAAKRPIIAYHDNLKLEKYGVHCTYDYDEFVEKLNSAKNIKKVDYTLKLIDKDWKIITDTFLNKIEAL